MRKLVFTALASGLLAPLGCYTPATSTGWSFQIGKPPSIMAPALVSQTQGLMAVAPVAAYPGAVASPAARPLAIEAPSDPCSTPTTARLALGNPCTLEDVCRRIDLIERRLRQPPAEPIQTMPRPLP